MTSTTRRRRPVTPSLSHAETRHRKNQANKVTRREGKAEAREAR
jgi:hypothetical protein